MQIIEFPTVNIENTNGIRLDLKPITDDELPTVSIVTVTYNRPEFINLMLRNFKAIDYPKEKLEWIVVDDSPIEIDYTSLKKAGAKVVRVPNKLILGRKRNFINCLTKNDYIVHIDDDDFYPSFSVIARIRVLLVHEKNIGKPGIVACQRVNCYDLLTDKTFEAYDASITTVSESTFAYSKKFWQQNPYNNEDSITECINFIGNNSVCIVPSTFVVTQLTHNTNTVTRRLASGTMSVNAFDFLRGLTASDSNIINNLKTQIILKMPEYKESIGFVKDILTIAKTENSKALGIIAERFADLEYNQRHDILKNRLVINTRYDYLITKKKTSGKDIVYYCGPGQFFGHESKWSPFSKTIGGSEEAVIKLSENLVKLGFNVTVYNVLDYTDMSYNKPLNCIKHNGVVYKPYWLWNPKDKQDLTIVWRDQCIIKDTVINSHKVYLDLHDAIEIDDSIKCDAIFVKSKFQRDTYCKKTTNRVVVVPNGIDIIDTEGIIKDPNMFLCTSSPDRCVTGLLDISNALEESNKIYWAYGFSAGVKEGGISTDDRPSVKKWYNDTLERINNSESFVNLDRLSQDSVAEFYKKAKYFIYGTKFPEIDCISLTKALSAGCIPIVAGGGALAEKLEYFEVPFVKVQELNWSLGIDTSLNKDSEIFKEWENLLKTHEINNNTIENIRERVNSEYNWKNIASIWSKEIQKTLGV